MVPVLVVEKVGPIVALKRSLSILRKTWGEALVGNFGIGLIIFLMALPACIPAVIGIFVVISTGSVAPVIIGGAVTALLLVLLSLVSSTLNTILVGALYQYAAEGKTPPQFDKSLLQEAFIPK